MVLDLFDDFKNLLILHKDFPNSKFHTYFLSKFLIFLQIVSSNISEMIVSFLAY